MLNIKFNNMHELLQEQSDLLLDKRLDELEEVCEMTWGSDTLLSVVEENITESLNENLSSEEFNLICESNDCFIMEDSELDSFL